MKLPVYFLKYLLEQQNSTCLSRQATIIKADVLLTSTSEKHIVNLVNILWSFEQTSQEVSNYITQVQYEPYVPIYLIFYILAEDRCVCVLNESERRKNASRWATLMPH